MNFVLQKHRGRPRTSPPLLPTHNIVVDGNSDMLWLRLQVFRMLKCRFSERLMHYVSWNVPSFQYPRFEHCFKSWDLVVGGPPNVKLPRAVSPTIDDAMKTFNQFREVRRLCAGDELSHWCKFEEFDPRGEGYAVALHRDSKFVLDVYVIFSYCNKWKTMKHKTKLYVSTGLAQALE